MRAGADEDHPIMAVREGKSQEDIGLLWVKSAVLEVGQPVPVFPDKQTGDLRLDGHSQHAVASSCPSAGSPTNKRSRDDDDRR